MNRILAALCCLLFSADKKDITVLNPKLPVIVTVSECPQKWEFEKRVIAELQKMSMKPMSLETSSEMLKEEFAKIQQSEPSEVLKIKAEPGAMGTYMGRVIDRIRPYAQRMYIKLGFGTGTVIDSCYYYIREQPEPMPGFSRRKTIDAKVFMQDSILRKNDMDVLVSAIVQRAMGNTH